jgi:hypothetical protein
MKIHVFFISSVQRCIAPGVFFYELHRKERMIWSIAFHNIRRTDEIFIL